MWREGIEQLADALPCRLNRTLGGFSQQMFELGEQLLDRVEIRAVGREEQEFCACRPDCSTHGFPLVAAQIVHDDDVARRQGRHEELLDPGGEELAVDRPVEDAGSVDPVVARRAARKVRVFHLPKGALATSLAPRFDQPRIGVMLVLAQVSSMKTSRLGSSLP